METIKDLPLMERPREKLAHFGPPALNNEELIAVLLGSGSQSIPLQQVSRNVVTAINDEPKQLVNLSIEQLCAIKGIGQVKAILLIAAIELGRRASMTVTHPVSMETDEQVLAFLNPYFEKQETPGYFLMLLNHRKELLATNEIPFHKKLLPSVKNIIKTVLSAGAAEFLLVRKEMPTDQKYFAQEQALNIQLDAAASMLKVKFRGLLFC